MTSGPIVVGGTGGSGTRAIVAFLAANGIAMGRDLNPMGDALAFVPLFDARIDAVIGAARRLDYRAEDVDPRLRAQVIADILWAALQHRNGSEPAQRWGFKNPRQMFLLPLLLAAFPNMIFMHVLREGRDMLFSVNRNQPRKHFGSLFGRPFANSLVDRARFWASTNAEVHAFGTRRLGPSYIFVPIEDLCAAGGQDHVCSLAARLGIDQDAAL